MIYQKLPSHGHTLLIAHSPFDGIQLMASLLSTISSSSLHQQDPIMGYELTESRTETNVDMIVHIYIISSSETIEYSHLQIQQHRIRCSAIED